MSALARPPEPSRCVDPTCRHSDGGRWTVCPRCKTSTADPRFTFPDRHTTYLRLKEPAADATPHDGHFARERISFLDDGASDERLDRIPGATPELDR